MGRQDMNAMDDLLGRQSIRLGKMDAAMAEIEETIPDPDLREEFVKEVYGALDALRRKELARVR